MTRPAYIQKSTGERFNRVVSGTQFYRVLHDAEMPDPQSIMNERLYGKGFSGWVKRMVAKFFRREELWREGVPEVYILSENKTDFTAGFQLQSYALNTVANPLITASIDPLKWRVLFDFMRAFTNGTGFNESGDPRVDFVNMRDIGAPLPKFDKARICGGALVTGVVDGNDLILETMNVYGGAPTLDWLLARPWLYFDAVNVTANGISRFPQGMNGNRVFIPLVTSQVERYPLAKLKKLPLGYDVTKHDPYKIEM
jgi:hypothetical protein